MKRANVVSAFFLFAAALFAAAPALAADTPGARRAAQDSTVGRLRLESLEPLKPKAAEAVDIDIDGILIKLAGSVLTEEDADERAVKEFVSGLKGVYVRSYEFKKEGEFTESDVSGVRAQLQSPAWSRVMDVKSRGIDFGDAEVYVASAGGRVQGLTLLVVEPKEVTVINIVGDVDLDKIKKLDGDLRLPHIHIRRNRRSKD
ncbi:MAG TPA: DUF4252 domain-containing protein [Pyrinomonadaceae bacterium]|nr:DUF4252 domain-containing protein [Pyrinomonadaceae bacterium]